MSDQDESLRTLVADVAAAYFSNSHTAPSDIPAVIAQIAASLEAVGRAEPESSQASSADETQKKATRGQVLKSITPEALISFEDGRPYKTLRRHLSVRGLTPEQYRGKWGLPDDYPMVAQGYSEQRKALAVKIGLGQKTAKAQPARRGGRRAAAK